MLVHHVIFIISLQGLELAPLNNLPIFHYLTHLKVDLHNSSWPVLPYLLECSPNLIIFELKKVSALKVIQYMTDL